MRTRLGAALLAATSTITFGLLGVGPAAADTPTVSGPDWSVSLEFPNVQWTGPGCQSAPVTAVVTGATVQSWTFGGLIHTSNDYDESYVAAFLDYDKLSGNGPGAFTFRHALPLLCPGLITSRSVEIRGEVGVLLAGATQWTWTAFSAAMAITGVATSISAPTIEIVGPQAIFSGQVSAATQIAAGCTGGVEIQMPDGEEGEWQSVGGADLLPDGHYVVMVDLSSLRGTHYRARYWGSQVCANSESSMSPLPVRRPVVKLSQVGSRNSRVRVEVDPDQKGGSWVFRVQLRTEEDGQWRELGRKYRTHGNRETRVVNLPKGRYRVHLLARFGYNETYSTDFFLER